MIDVIKKTWILILAAIGIAIFSIGGISKGIPEHLQLKVPKGQIISVETVDDIRCDKLKLNCTNYGQMKKYLYMDQEAPAKTLNGMAEIKRYYNGHLYHKESRPNEEVYVLELYPERPYYSDGEKSYYVEKATTTIDAYEEQTQISIFDWEYAFAIATTIHPNPHTESTSVDGYVRYQDDGIVWATIRNALSGTTHGDEGVSQVAWLFADASANWDIIERGFFLFDFTQIPGGATVISLVFSLHGTTGACQDNLGGLDISVASSSPATTTDLVADDYDQVGRVKFATDIDIGAWDTGDYNDWTFNATGLAAAQAAIGGILKLSTQLSGDIDDTNPFVAGEQARCEAHNAERAGTGEDPRVVIEYSIAVVAVPDLIQTQTWGNW